MRFIIFHIFDESVFEKDSYINVNSIPETVTEASCPNVGQEWGAQHSTLLMFYAIHHFLVFWRMELFKFRKRFVHQRKYSGTEYFEF